MPAATPLWLLGAVLALYGLGVGLMLSVLHHAALGKVPANNLGAASGLYAMLRFLGVVIGTALAGVILQHSLDRSLPTIAAYQNAFLFLTAFVVAGLLVAFRLRD